MFEAVNTWVGMGGFRPNHPDLQTAMSFTFHHIRPTQDLTYTAQSGVPVKLRKGEVSLIGGTSRDAFTCFKRAGSAVSPADLVRMYLPREVMAAPKGQFVQWSLPFTNLYGGPWEVFNGPNPIVIRQARV
jgi:hypothetical protein